MMQKKSKLVNYWLEGSKVTLKLAKDVLDKGYYEHSLFCGHLALEKLIKSFIVDKKNTYAPHSHDLIYLAGLAEIDLNEKEQKFLVDVNYFNIEGRYPEEKLEFSHQINKATAKEWLKKIEDFYQWLLK